MHAHARSAEEVLAHFGVESAAGLSPGRAAELLETHGPNALERQERIPWWKVLARQFRGPMVYLLAGAAVISFGMKEHLDGVAILIVILINGILGFVEQLSEVNVDGVEPMTSVTPMAMKKRADVVTDGNKADAIVANAKQWRARIATVRNA